MVRIVRTPDGSVSMDETGKRAGRGTYVCRSQRCWGSALRTGSLSRVLKCEIGADDRQQLERQAAQFPEEDPTAAPTADRAPGR